MGTAAGSAGSSFSSFMVVWYSGKAMVAVNLAGVRVFPREWEKDSCALAGVRYIFLRASLGVLSEDGQVFRRSG